MPSLHMPLQSGSRPVLKAMRRAYRARQAISAIMDSVRRRSRPRRSPPTSSSASPARRRPTSHDTLDVAGRPGSRAPSRSATPSVPARPPRRWTTRFPPEVVAGALRTAGCACRGGLRRRRTRASTARPSRSWSPRAKAARTPRRTACRAVPGTTAWCICPHATVAAARRRRHHAVTSTAPHYLIADGEPLGVRRTRAATPGRRARSPRRPVTAAEGQRPRPSCSACPPAD